MNLIDKDALVAEIEKQGTIQPQLSWFTDKLIQIINSSLEVKEVDLNKYINKYFKRWYVDLTDQGNILHSPDGQAGLMSVKKVAKHFFELGLKTK